MITTGGLLAAGSVLRRKRLKRILLIALLVSTSAFAQAPSPAAPATTVPSNLVVENVPEFPAALAEKVGPYLDYRTAALADWNPQKAEMLIRTRFGETMQLHLVKMPGGARRQLTFFDETVASASFHPNDPNTVVFGRDIGGNEFFQLYRMNLSTAEATLLTDGKSRNLGVTFSRDGKVMAFSSTRRTGRDTDIWILNPFAPQDARMVLQVEGGGWFATDFSKDGTRLLVTNNISANETQLYLVDIASGSKTLLTPRGEVPVSYSGAEFAADDRSIYFTSDEGSELQQLRRMNLADTSQKVITSEKWEIPDFDLSHDRSRIAYETNENGVSVLHLVDTNGIPAKVQPKLPQGVIGGLRWHPNGKMLGFSITSARSATDVYSLDVDNGKLTRWTESETGGLDPEKNAEPQLVTMKSFDGLQISAFVYRPDAKKFAGKRPVIINIHGGPEGQSQPVFLGRANYWINEQGIVLIYPNVRGSEGYGKSYLAADNGFKREDSVKDIGAVLDWIATDPQLDPSRVAVYGGSYGGYMVLASMVMHRDRLKAGIDVVGISSFLTFLENTSGYRRDLRRVEYGDERDPKMNAFLQRISPMTNASQINDPLFVIMGMNDPRVPYTEGEQVVKAVRANGAPVWYLAARDEGHGFAKRRNQDYQFIAMTLFWQQHLLQ